MKLYKSLLLVFFLMSILIMPNLAYAQNEKPEIPQWIKNTAKWWSENKTTDEKFLIGITFLAKAGMLDVSDIKSGSSESKIPYWFKSVASWYASNEITEEDFENAVQYLIETNSIKVSQNLFNVIESRGLTPIEYSGNSPLFRTFAYSQDFRIIGGKPTPLETYFALKPELERNGTYDKFAMWDTPHNAVVIVPLFTSTAYWEPGFYTYYRGDCDTICLTKKITFDQPGGFSASQNAVNLFTLLGYDTITDLDVDNNPLILSKYHKVIVLHNEYVTQKEFDAITHHPKVVYLYANSLYAQVDVDYQNDTITLLKGHGYPTSEIRNAFGWKFDNHQREYDTNCGHDSFYKVDNGIMLDCYPENTIYVNMTLLKIIKDY